MIDLEAEDTREGSFQGIKPMHTPTITNVIYSIPKLAIVIVAFGLPQTSLLGDGIPYYPTSFTLNDEEPNKLPSIRDGLERNRDLDFAEHRAWLGRPLQHAMNVDRNDRSESSFYYGVEHVDWKMRRRDLDFAVTNSGSALAIGSGEIKELSFDRDGNFKAFM